MNNYSEYIASRTEAIHKCITELGCQPIIFAGAGLSKRYIGGPSWIELLTGIANDNPHVRQSIAYYLQKYQSPLEVGEQLVNDFHNWAWSEGREKFNPTLFEASVQPKEFLKDYVGNYINARTPPEISSLPADLSDEIKLLQETRPHSVITTNYDTLCELIFPEYTRIVGQKIIRTPGLSIGEIFKIHGCVTDPTEIVLTNSDYTDWSCRKKYLSAKLLTYFLEHPVLIVGYGAQDPNVLAILRDIDEILASPGAVVPNIFYVIYDKEIQDSSIPPNDLLLDLGRGTSMRVNALHAKEFNWIYRAFAANTNLENINPKVLRALLARTYDLVRHDIPRMSVQVDFATLEQAAASDDRLPKLLGITGLGDPDMFNATYPYSLTAVAQKLGYTTWHSADQLHDRIYTEKNITVKSTDNQYHINVKAGEKGAFRKYSEAFVELLRKVKNNEDYQIILKNKSSNK
ncbi:SIR2 family protein [Xanthomonas oryzae]|uniref:SIR2 family protein n=1 Tax=Xanthomonas oryzae TaxID=347 RepID=UPI000949FD4B|nr:SIR2 family protein [Xanthomonas oryzae]OLG76649.1 hypothetical protein BXO432_18380 [Xanthomonas oryzae pv. oryzae]QEJ67534.1 SIR2 family protein [Xanthomonas oryzae pv. oryzae]